MDISQQTFFESPREDGVICLKRKYIELEFDPKQTVRDDSANGTDKCLVELGPISSFSEIRLTTSSRKI